MGPRFPRRSCSPAISPGGRSQHSSTALTRSSRSTSSGSRSAWRDEFFPGVILYLTYWFPGARRAKIVALFHDRHWDGVGRLAGLRSIMQFMDGVHRWRGWQSLFLLEGIPSVIIGALVLAILPNGPKAAKWLTADERRSSGAADRAGQLDQGRTTNTASPARSGIVCVSALAAVLFALATCSTRSGSGCRPSSRNWASTRGSAQGRLDQHDSLGCQHRDDDLLGQPL